MPGTSYSSSSQNTWFTACSRDTQEIVTERQNSYFPSKAMTIQFRSGWGGILKLRTPKQEESFMTKKKIFSSLVFPRPKVGIQSIRSRFELSESISIRHKIVDIIFEAQKNCANLSSLFSLNKIMALTMMKLQRSQSDSRWYIGNFCQSKFQARNIYRHVN